MPAYTYTNDNGDRYIFEYTGKVIPDAQTVRKVYNGQSKDIRVKKVKLVKGAENIGTTEGLVKNFNRGFTWSLSRKVENNSKALDKWNEDNPVKSSIADVVGSLPTALLPGGVFATGAKVLSKIKPLVAVATKLGLANKLKNVVKVLKMPVVKAATAGGTYSGFRSFVDSKDADPDNITKNVFGSTLAGSVGGAALGFLGHKVGSLMNKKSVKANTFINRLGGEGEFKKITASNGRLIESGSPLIAQLLKSSELSPYDKVVLLKNFMKVKNQIPEKIEKVVNELTPKKTQAQVMNKYKKVADARYAQGDFNKPLEVKASITEIKPKGNRFVSKIVPYNENTPFFNEAYRRASKRNPAAMGKDAVKDKQWLKNDLSTKQLIGVRAELYDMLGKAITHNDKMNAIEIQGEINVINKKIKATNPNISKADQTFSRSKGVEKRYNEGLTYSGRKAGEGMPKDTSSFIRGILEQIQANKRYLPDPKDVNSIDKVFQPHIKEVLNESRPATMKKAETTFRKLKNEHNNLKAATSNPAVYEKAMNLGGSDVFRFMTMPRNAAGRKTKNLLDAVEKRYEQNPQEIMSKMYEPASKVYKDTMRDAVPTKKGKVLNTVLQAFAQTGGRGIWGNRR